MKLPLDMFKVELLCECSRFEGGPGRPGPTGVEDDTRTLEYVFVTTHLSGVFALSRPEVLSNTGPRGQLDLSLSSLESVNAAHPLS